MGQLARKGDTNQTGGKIMRGASTVVCNGLPVGLHVSKMTPHSPKPNKSPHNSAVTVDGSPNVICEGLPVLRTGSRDNCGHSIVIGSENVVVS